MHLLHLPAAAFLLAISAAADAAPKKVVDAGTAVRDAGIVVRDAGIVVRDAGTPVRDAGTVVRDAGTPAPVAIAAAPVTAPDKKTERLWKSKCGACHGLDGKAATEKGRKMKMTDLTSAAFQKDRTDDTLRKAIVEGLKLKKDGIDQVMDPYGPELTRDQVDALIAYVRWVGKR